MEEIKGYKTYDGKIFTDINEASSHEDELRFKIAVEKFVDKHCFSGMLNSDIIDILIENRDELMKIFKGK